MWFITLQRVKEWPDPSELRREGKFACLDFVNSEWTDWRGVGPPTDRLGDRDWWIRFLARWRLATPGLGVPRGRRLSAFRRLRSVMRAIISEDRRPAAAEIAELNRGLARSLHRWRLDSRLHARVIPAERGWSAVMASLILSFGELQNKADASRLKTCANPDCSYVFYDVSSNHSRRWCFSNVCGNLMHVRGFRRRN